MMKHDERSPLFNRRGGLTRFFGGMAAVGLVLALGGCEKLRQVVENVVEHIEMNPDDPRALYLGAAACIELGDRDKGLSWARRALASDPEEPNVLYNVACAFATADENEEAIGLLEKAVATEPENPNFLDSLGWAYFKAGRLREAQERIQRSLEIDDSGPSGATRRSHLEEVEAALRSDSGSQLPSEDGGATN